MTTPTQETGTVRSASGPPSALTTVNLGVALISAVLLGALVMTSLLLSSGSEKDNFVTGIATYLVIVIVLAMASAVICAWHGSIPESKEDSRRTIGLVAWILTYVGLGFAALGLLLVVVKLWIGVD